MTQTDLTLNPGTAVWPYPHILQESWRTWAFRRLDAALANAVRLPFNSHSRFVLFSDLHRGDGGPTDRFQPNKSLFLQALRHYYENGYTYIEVGDGDELWLHDDLQPIVRAHRDVFEWLHRFKEDGRLHILYGNHDIKGPEDCPPHKDGIPTHEALVLQHANGQRLFICHGHQADLTNARLYALTRFLNKSLWRWLRLQSVGLIDADMRVENHILNHIRHFFKVWTHQQPRHIENRLKEWAVKNQQPIICGHTHRMALPGTGGVPYFNTGSCLTANRLSGLELIQGQLKPVHWAAGQQQRVGVYRDWANL